MIPLIQQNAEKMDQLMCAETDAESRGAETTGDGGAEGSGLAGRWWNGKIAFMAGLIL